jgi:uncharacterized protein (DUF305 family)
MGKRVTTVLALATATVAGGLLLAACEGQNGGASPSPTATAVFNDADVTFAQQMIVHHQQAVMMAEMAETRAQDPRVKQLAEQIKAEQEPEIETMARWLQAWGQPVPSMAPGMPHMSPGPHMPSMTPQPSMTPHMPTMTPQPDMSSMMGMHGAQFDQTFLTMMIAHHEDAVEMAQTEQASGVNPEAKQLAKSIEASQSAQINQMRQMLASPSPAPS